MRACLRTVVMLAAAIGWLAAERVAPACPFCSSLAPSLSERMELSDIVCLVRLVSVEKSNDAAAAAFGVESWQADFELDTVLRGAEKLNGRRRFETTLLQKPAAGDVYLVMGAATPKLDWSQPIPLTARGREYLLRLAKLPREGHERLAFLLPYLDDREELLSQDAYAEFADAPFDGVRKLKPRLDRREIIDWIVDPKTKPEYFGLYFTLLSICGTAQDAKFLEKAMLEGSREGDEGFDSLIACYLTLSGEPGLNQLRQAYFGPAASVPAAGETATAARRFRSADLHAAISALRFHGEEAHVFTRQQIIAVFRAVLERTELAGLVIPDLARWEDWDSADRLAKLFLEVDEQHSLLRTPIVQFLQVCPLPAAKAHLENLTAVAPDAVARAKALGVLQSRAIKSGEQDSPESPPETQRR